MGFTNTGPDVQDLFIEKLDMRRQLSHAGWPARFPRESTRRSSQGRKRRELEIRFSRHGTVILGRLAARQSQTPPRLRARVSMDPLAEDTARCRPRTASPARRLSQFLAAAARFPRAAQNMVFADVEGNIGFIAPAGSRAQARERPQGSCSGARAGKRATNWDAGSPFEELPQSYNPAAASLWSANEKITPHGYAHLISSEWAPPFRADRIAELLQATPKHSVASFARIQSDVVSRRCALRCPGCWRRSRAARTRARRSSLCVDGMERWPPTGPSR
jgi:penicillin amidase